MDISNDYFKLNNVIISICFAASNYATDVDLLFEYVIIGSVFPLTTVLSTVTDSTFSISGKVNMVLSKIDSKIDLKPLAPVFLFIAFFAISLRASSLNSSLTSSNSNSLKNK